MSVPQTPCPPPVEILSGNIAEEYLKEIITDILNEHPEIVKDVVEPEFSSWSLLWKKNTWEDDWEDMMWMSFYPLIIRPDEDNDKIFMYTPVNAYVATAYLSNGTYIEHDSTWTGTQGHDDTFGSASKYIAYAVEDGSNNLILVVMSKSTIKQEINLTSLLGWDPRWIRVAFSPDGKYLMVSDSSMGTTHEIALFRGVISA